MSDTEICAGKLIRASWRDVADHRPQGRPVECLGAEAITLASVLAAMGLGTITFTANREAAGLLGLIKGEEA